MKSASSLLAGSRYPRKSELATQYANLLGYPNVLGCYLGRKHVNGRRTGSLAIICLVSEKVPSTNLHPTRERLPRHVTWKATRRRTASLLTDVQRLRQPFRVRGPILGPGDVVRAGEVGTVGAALIHPRHGQVFAIAGHVAWQGRIPVVTTFPAGTGPSVQIRSTSPTGESVVFKGRVVRVRIDDQGDYAIAVPAENTCPDNVYQDRLNLGVEYVPSETELGRPAIVLRTPGQAVTRMRGIHGMLTFGGLTMRDLILTDLATVGGDSGFLLVDSASRIMGMLVGTGSVERTNVSAFMPIDTLLRLENAELA